MKYLNLCKVSFFGTIILFFSCGIQSKTQSYDKAFDVSHSETLVKTVSKVPKGDELKFDITRVSSNEFNVKITNISTEEVFCSYLPQINSSRAEYFPFIAERRKGRNGEFIKYSDGVDFVPGLYPINPNQFVEFSFYSNEIGEYRIKFSYLVDKAIAQRVNSITGPPGLEDSERDLVYASYFEVTSPTMFITKSKKD